MHQKFLAAVIIVQRKSCGYSVVPIAGGSVVLYARLSTVTNLKVHNSLQRVHVQAIQPSMTEQITM
jgi:hypothetical protein